MTADKNGGGLENKKTERPSAALGPDRREFSQRGMQGTCLE